MFTGIITDVGRIEHSIREDNQMHIHLVTTLDTSKWQCGDSVAVDGCCLTITALPSMGKWHATLSAETLALTHFDQAQIGQRVNMEPALCVGDPLGGHMVSGHIDSMAQIVAIDCVGDHRCYHFALPAALAPLIVHKGSIAINGVSLTINSVKGDEFSVNLIPHTLKHTNLGFLKKDDWVNIETDMFGRYIQRMLQVGYLGTCNK
ncbi:MAG: riboflavin synthase [Mariprofundaceae bacterium]|nr:riboflavin synthase [Mariprofundaceae bacterium]